MYVSPVSATSRITVTIAVIIETIIKYSKYITPVKTTSSIRKVSKISTESVNGIPTRSCGCFIKKFTGKHLCWSVFFHKVAGLKNDSKVVSTELAENINSYIKTATEDNDFKYQKLSQTLRQLHLDEVKGKLQYHISIIQLRRLEGINPIRNHYLCNSRKNVTNNW